MRTEPNTFDLALLAVRRALSAGASEAEAYVVRKRSIEARIENNAVAGVEGGAEYGIALRVAVGKRIGFSFATDPSPRSIGDVAEAAVSVAKASSPDPAWPGLPSPATYTVPENIYNPELLAVREERLVKRAREMVETAKGVEGAVVVRGAVGVEVSRVSIVNTNGLANTQVLSHGYGYAMVIARSAGAATPYVYDAVFSRVTLPDTARMTRELAEMARGFLSPAARLEEKASLPVILHPLAQMLLYEYTLVKALSGDAVAETRSPYTNMVDEQVMNPSITIIDDGLLRGGLNTRIFDDEGVPMQRTVLVEKGVFKSPFFDHYWGSRMGVGSTGNGLRRDARHPPGISHTNIVIEPGEKSLEKILSSIDRGVYVYLLQGAHSSNPETGEYSCVAAPAWLVEKGEMKPLRPVMVSGNLYEQLRGDVLLSRESMVKGHLRAPYIVLPNTMVVPRG